MARARGSTSSSSAAIRNTAPRKRSRNWRRSSPRGTASSAPYSSPRGRDDQPDRHNQPVDTNNIPGLEALKSADLMVIFTAVPEPAGRSDAVRRGLPRRGQAGRRPANRDARVQHPEGPEVREVLVQLAATRATKQASASRCSARRGSTTTAATARKAPAGGSPDAGAKSPILKGIKDGEIFGTTDVYTVNLPLPGDSDAAGAGRSDRDAEAGLARGGRQEERPDDARRVDAGPTRAREGRPAARSQRPWAHRRISHSRPRGG